jgi:hypothetical protein
MMNIATEEFDKFLEKYNEDTIEIYSEKKENDDDLLINLLENFDSEEEEDTITELKNNMLKKQLEDKKLQFKKSISELKREYDLIVQHRVSLEEKLYLIEVDKY